MRLALAGAACVLAAGCASAPAAGGGDSAAAGTDATEFVVQNDLASGRDVQVYLEPEGRGERQQLGRVPAGQTVTLTAVVERGYYILVAGHEMGDVRSARFNVPGPSTVRWQLLTERLQVRRR